MVTSYFRCSSLRRIAGVRRHHRAGADVDVHLELADAAVARPRRAQPPAVRHLGLLRIAVHAHARVRVPLLVERPRLERALDVEDAQDRELRATRARCARSRRPREHGRDARPRPPSAGAAARHRAQTPRAPTAASAATKITAVGASVSRSRAQHQHAAERRAGQIGRIEPARPVRPNCVSASDTHMPLTTNGTLMTTIGEHHRVGRDDRRVHEERDAELRQEAQDDQDRERQRRARRAAS